MSCYKCRNVGWNWFRSCRVSGVETSDGVVQDRVNEGFGVSGVLPVLRFHIKI